MHREAPGPEKLEEVRKSLLLEPSRRHDRTDWHECEAGLLWLCLTALHNRHIAWLGPFLRVNTNFTVVTERTAAGESHFTVQAAGHEGFLLHTLHSPEGPLQGCK